MSVESERYDAPVQKFQALQLSIPLDPTQFDYIKLFLDSLLNVEEPLIILNPPKNSYDPTKSREILPDILLPNDLWLRDNVTTKDIKVKVTMLTEINTMISNEIAHFDGALDDTTLLYYQKLLVAYKFFDLPIRTAFTSSLNDFPVKEEIEEEDSYNLDDGQLLVRSVSNQSSTNSLKTHQSFFSHSSVNNSTQTTANNNSLTLTKRNSNHSKENLLSRKRILTFMSNHSSKSNPTTPTSGTFDFDEKETNDEEHKKQQALNALLSKSKIYNKLKKNRELTSSMNSNMSLPYSARNSVSTTGTINSNSRSKRSSNITTPENDSRHPTVALPAFATYSIVQKQEIQKSKYDYYCQIEILLGLIEGILHQLRLNHKDAKSFKLMDFIKRYLFKFIVLDTSDMVLTYGEIEAHRLYSRKSL